MCGICGKLNFDREKPVEPDLLPMMMSLIRHRGPDGAGEYLSGPVGLGHVRLSIIDLDTGRQPMCNEDGTIWVAYNGEIYNFRELRSELEKRGHRFKSASDTEVIVHMYEEMGDDCVTRFQGMFAFALWDERRQKLLLARDRVGIKPLYFANTKRAIVFASEIKAILADPEVTCRINPRAIDRFLTYYYLPGDETLLDGINKLEPGHCLTVVDGCIKVRQYWDLNFDSVPQRLSFDEAVKNLRSLLSRTVRDHMISDVPVGVLLSGGVDSTAVLNFATGHAQGPLHTFTMGFSDDSFADERPFARLAAQRFGTTHHEVSMTAESFRDFMPKFVWHMEEPVCEPPAIALHFVSRLAQESGVKVLLSGEGADEAFGGYQDYRNLLLLELLKSGFGPLKGILKVGFQALSDVGWKRGSHYAGLVESALPDYYFSRTSTPQSPFNRLKSRLYRRAHINPSGDTPSDEPTRHLWDKVRGQPILNRMLYVDTKTWLPDDLLVKADKMTMAASVELRVPFLDSRVLEFAASLPHQYKVSGMRLKRVLKAALAPSIPKEILTRKKTGFPVPYSRWLRQELRPYVRDTLLADHSFSRDYFSQKEILKMLDAQHRGEDYAKEVFSLLVLELWNQQFLGPRPPAAEHEMDELAMPAASAAY